MTRHNFPPSVKKTALARSGGRCEGVGARYGQPPGERCPNLLAVTGIEYDHYPLGAHDPASAHVENCWATCPRCNQYAANHTDKAVEAKIKRVRRKHGYEPDLRKPRRPIPAGRKLHSRNDLRKVTI